MNDKIPPTNDQRMRAEFDSLADEYHDQHKENIAITGEGPEFFSEYKISDLAALIKLRKLPANSILDFGSGIGNSLPYFRKYFPDAVLNCGDVSGRSIEIAKTRFPGNEQYALIGDRIPLDSGSQDIVFSACVFHHIPHEDHQHWLQELHRVTRPGGLLVIYEHNPFNPLTVRAVNTCPLDVNAKLIIGRTMGKRAELAGWNDAKVTYRMFFPSMFRVLRPAEKYLGWLALGAQYRMSALKQQ
ncbi:MULTISPECIES: class I SAM-dependent methyltransferase [unclassified Pseudomonas]|uniref:Class I SAM-dependent methyltransferase n=1 Tax=Pseudomonas sp. MYb327 TaxID=2745230 RepID=A0AAU8DY36_9PSED